MFSLLFNEQRSMVLCYSLGQLLQADVPWYAQITSNNLLHILGISVHEDSYNVWRTFNNRFDVVRKIE